MRLPIAATILGAVSVSACALLPMNPSASVDANAPAAVAGRTSLPSCGVEQSGQGGPYDEVARACFWRAYEDRRPAEFISSRPTTEGDPITWIYRVLPDGSVEVFIDSTRDTYGSGVWSHARCRTLARQMGGGIATDFGPDDTCVFEDLP